ncbi:hypothetical protein EJ05DRAFT_122949 [Pseudovirgaria hyperparasitica]|uniref:DNA excision repair protein n=1 Tax=Pseudovirgaria hyperparasitica TaxID=470096 RepID=A0A6A6W0L7_9PEZI|nr:uncharacterized protein EJ05DRAFT_122949 [Pseudovirgaria hyperparasitica]KAF2755117.1 hypothetical protein EJ05DRAFT_122949 [Pseudovirgaria hyperparasitica]
MSHIFNENVARRVFGEDTDSGSGSEIGITDVVRKEVGLPETTDISQYIEDVVNNAAEISDIDEEGDKVDWSEDEDGAVTYDALKNQKALKRKRAAEQTRRARAVISAGSTKASSKSIVGRKPKRVKRERVLANLDETDEDELLDETLPDYIKQRKTKFEQTRARLGEAGLKLPPVYDDIEFSDDERLESLQEKPRFDHIKPVRQYEDITLPASAGVIPAPIAQWLRDYQVKGAEFLHELFVYQRGGILGDDMGLGKTIQVISFLTAAFGKTGDERDKKRMRKVQREGGQQAKEYPKIILICPGGLMANWQDELDRWGYWQVYVYHGATDVREAALQAAKHGRVEIMITTYATYRKNQSAINTINWDCVIADECHQLKSRSSEIAKSMNEVNALCRIGLTGTAIQNKYEELFTLLNWSNPGHFGSLATWKTCIADPLKMGQSHDATMPQLAKARKTANSLVHSLLPRFFLRRMKTLIADQLPKKSDRVVFCPLTKKQAEAYSNLVNSDLVEYIRTSADKCDCKSEKKRGWCCYSYVPEFGPWQNAVFPCMMMLQKLSNHLALLLPTSADPAEKQAKDLEHLKDALPKDWKELYRQRDSIMNYASPTFCGKWRVLKALLQYWHASGDKVLVFSHSVRLLRMLHLLFTTTTTYNVSYLDGAMSLDDRAKEVNDFNADKNQFVFLISTKAGGVGLNITSANKVVVFDPNWNPAYDLQAQDRAYRIGQVRDVEVFRLISAGTIEEIVYARQIYKQQQANIGYNASNERRYFKGIQDKKDHKGEIFGLHNMFTFRDGAVVLRDIVNKTNVAEAKEAGVQAVAMDLQNDAEDDDFIYGADGKEGAAMSQLAELIQKDKIGSQGEKFEDKKQQRKADPISAILAGAGVEYTHENAEVIGSSKVESKLSRNALEMQNDTDMTRKRAFAASATQQEDDHDDIDDELEVIGERSFATEDDEKEHLNIRWKYQPPEDVRIRQFCTMAQTFGFKDAVEFAIGVEGWTQEQRRNCLERFYRMRRNKVLN